MLQYLLSTVVPTLVSNRLDVPTSHPYCSHFLLCTPIPNRSTLVPFWYLLEPSSMHLLSTFHLTPEHSGTLPTPAQPH